jgi:hypothetical protein
VTESEQKVTESEHRRVLEVMVEGAVCWHMRAVLGVGDSPVETCEFTAALANVRV